MICTIRCYAGSGFAGCELGRPARKLLLHANRNGFLYVLDRTTGKFSQRNHSHILPGRKKLVRMAARDCAGQRAHGRGRAGLPSALGATNWFSPSYNRKPDGCMWRLRKPATCLAQRHRSTRRHDFLEVFMCRERRKGVGRLRALDPLTGEKKWEFSTVRLLGRCPFDSRRRGICWRFGW